MAEMNPVVFIDAAYKDQVANILQRTLEIQNGAAKDIVKDGMIQATELLDYRHQIALYPSSRAFNNTLASRIYNDQFMQEKGGYGVNFFKELYDKTIEEAAKKVGDDETAKKGGKSPTAIDCQEDVDELERLLKEFTKKESRNKKLDHLRQAIEKRAAREVKADLVSIGNDRYKGTMNQDAPFPIEQVRDFVFGSKDDKNIQKLVDAVSFLINVRKVCESTPLTQGGLILFVELSTPVFKDRQDYIDIQPKEEMLPGGRKQYAFTWRKLTADEIKACGEKEPKPPLNALETTIILTELENGWTRIEIEMIFDPNLSKGEYFLGWVVSGASDPILSKMKPVFKGAFRSVAENLARDAYYFGCIGRREGATCPKISAER